MSLQSSLQFYRKHDYSRANSNRFYSAENMFVHDEPTVTFLILRKTLLLTTGQQASFPSSEKLGDSRWVNSCYLFTTWRAKSSLPFYGKHDCARKANHHRLNSAENIIIHDEPPVIASILYFCRKHGCSWQAESHRFNSAEKTWLFTTNQQSSMPFCENIIFTTSQ